MASLSAVSLEIRKRKAEVLREIELARKAIEQCEQEIAVLYLLYEPP